MLLWKKLTVFILWLKNTFSNAYDSAKNVQNETSADYHNMSYKKKPNNCLHSTITMLSIVQISEAVTYKNILKQGDTKLIFHWRNVKLTIWKTNPFKGVKLEQRVT